MFYIAEAVTILNLQGIAIRRIYINKVIDDFHPLFNNDFDITYGKVCICVYFDVMQMLAVP